MLIRCILYGRSAYIFTVALDSQVNCHARYAFPYEELAGGIIDMTEEQKHFYFNPYSGELSLTFPRAEKKCRGGILACVALGLVNNHMLTIVTGTVTVCSFLLVIQL
jgi:hypothetical protein